MTDADINNVAKRMNLLEARLEVVENKGRAAPERRALQVYRNFEGLYSFFINGEQAHLNLVEVREIAGMPTTSSVVCGSERP